MDPELRRAGRERRRQLRGKPSWAAPRGTLGLWGRHRLGSAHRSRAALDPAAAALPRLGGAGARIAEGPRWELLSECALSEAEQQWLGRAKGASLDEALAGAPGRRSRAVVYALVQIGVLTIEMAGMKSQKKRAATRERFDPIDAQAVRSQVKARLNLVEEGDYFSLLGVPRSATAYEIHRAYLELRRGFEPSRVLNAATADLADDLELIIEVLDEAHDVLRDQSRRERYRRAIEDKPPS